MSASYLDQKNFCSMPWFGLAIGANGNIKPCCQYKNGAGNTQQNDNIVETYKGDHMKKLREQFLKGKRPSACKSCWEREDQIGTSRRMWFKEKFEKFIPKDYNFEKEVQEPQWIQMDLNFSNVCNLKCRMCGSWASNQWFEEDIQLASISKDFQKESNPDLQKIIQHNNSHVEQLVNNASLINRIDFKGGEPMLAKNHTDFLELLISKGHHKHVTLQYTTNGTVQNPNILNLLKQFKSIRMVFSIEGTGSLFKYIRGGDYEFEHCVENYKKYSELKNIHTMFNVTVQTYNVTRLHELYHWIYNQNVVDPSQAFTTICNQPDYLSPINIPNELKEKCFDNLNHIKDFNHLLSSMKNTKFDDNKWNIFCNFTNELDRIRNTNILEHLPEMEPWFKN